MTEETIKVFEPAGGNYLKEYPEFKSIPEFENLTEPEMKFVYFMYSPCSQFVKSNKADRFAKSNDLAFTNGSTSKRFTLSNTPPHIEAAGERMAKINVGMRTQADNLVRQMFTNLIRVASVDEKTVDAMDLTDKKKYVEMTISTTQALGVMINNMEGGFGTRPIGGKVKAVVEEIEDTKKSRIADKVMEGK